MNERSISVEKFITCVKNIATCTIEINAAYSTSEN